MNISLEYFLLLEHLFMILMNDHEIFLLAEL